MANYNLCVYLLGFAACLCPLEAVQIPTVTDAAAEDIRYAGSADGKTFFAVYNSTTKMNWFESGEACRQMNMILAEISSVAQANAIKTYVNSGQIIRAAYWIGGRDAWSHRQFSWNTTNADISNTNISISVSSNSLPSFLTCVIYDGSNNRFIIIPCSYQWNYRICEVITSGNY